MMALVMVDIWRRLDYNRVADVRLREALDCALPEMLRSWYDKETLKQQFPHGGEVRRGVRTLVAERALRAVLFYRQKI